MFFVRCHFLWQLPSADYAAFSATLLTYRDK
jgi:hypothetical protein